MRKMAFLELTPYELAYIRNEIYYDDNENLLGNLCPDELEELAEQVQKKLARAAAMCGKPKPHNDDIWAALKDAAKI